MKSPREPPKKVGVNGEDIAIFNIDGQYLAIGDICPHRGAPLSEGFVEAGKVFCPWHCFDFNLQTGKCEIVPSMSVLTYEIKVEGNQISVLV